LPLQWPEPFGLVAIESLACGTPVVAPCGAMPELVRHGVHGYLAATEDELVEGCRLVHRLDRHACRRWALERFSQQRMTGGYEEVYLRLLGVTRVKMNGQPEPIIVPLPEEG
jgi:glycosyltransferase involved in cell wall biosynthesis